jgi:hypothetical protein
MTDPRRTEIARTFLRMLAGPGVSNASYYVRLADKYDVPVDDIVTLTGFDRDRVIGWIQEPA